SGIESSSRRRRSRGLPGPLPELLLTSVDLPHESTHRIAAFDRSVSVRRDLKIVERLPQKRRQRQDNTQ
ncbi:MAG: hypothetical protein KA152_17040, partial [Verrucomicrobiales bacterium]|nr:hypothetical protein [Verrucomicrobiales bacterium]